MSVARLIDLAKSIHDHVIARRRHNERLVADVNEYLAQNRNWASTNEREKIEALGRAIIESTREVDGK